jgi:ribosome maturation factor RimP
MIDIAALTALITPIVTDLGYDLVRVQMNGSKSAQTLQIMAEDRATGQLTLEQCATISRALSEMLDATDPIEHEYRLEVSSPGIDRPLTRAADYAKWLGHEVRLKLIPGEGGPKRLHGTIGPLVFDAVTIEVPTAGPTVVPLASIEGAKLVLTNKLIAATRPLNAEGADEIIELPAPANDDQEEDD